MTEKGIVACGVASRAELEACGGWPSEERLSRGPVAVIECIQQIPCNPCEDACPKKAITVGEHITSCPTLNGEACVGCGLCIAKCPGQAIFVVDASGNDATVDFPYEYMDMPEEGEKVDALNRYGRIIGEASIVHVKRLPSFDKTAVIRMRVPKDLAMEARSIRRRV